MNSLDLPANVVKALNARQERFVTEFANCGNATKAAKLAGYSERTAHVQACDLLKKPNIKAAVRARQKELAKAGQMTREEWVQGLARLAKEGETHHVRVRAHKELGKALGWYEPEKHEVSFQGGITYLPPEEPAPDGD